MIAWRLYCPTCEETYLASLLAPWACPRSEEHEPIRVTPNIPGPERIPETPVLDAAKLRGKPYANPYPRRTP